MTLKLILMRHAKSDWDDPLLDDHDRPLNTRGRHAAATIGAWLSKLGHLPDQALCSSAVRTRETLALASAQWPVPPNQVILPELYLAGAQQMLDVLRAKGSENAIIMLGHNPGIGTMAGMLARIPPSDPDFHRYPTAYTAIFEFDVQAWTEVDWGMGKIVACTAPRALNG